MSMINIIIVYLIIIQQSRGARIYDIVVTSSTSPTAHFICRPLAIQSGVRGHPPVVVRSAPRRQRRGNLRTVLAAWANLPARLLAATSRQSRSCARPSVCAAPLRIVASLLIFGASSTPFSGFAQFSHHSARSSGRLAANAAKRSPLGWAASVFSGVFGGCLFPGGSVLRWVEKRERKREGGRSIDDRTRGGA